MTFLDGANTVNGTVEVPKVNYNNNNHKQKCILNLRMTGINFISS